MKSLGLFFLLIVSRIKMVNARTGYMFHSKRIGTERTPENGGFLGILLCCIPLGGKEK